MTDNDPKTLLQAVQHFDLKMCRDYMVGIKWPTGTVTCPKCSGNNIGLIETRSRYTCRAKDCRKQFSHKVGTIFENSPLGLDKWFVAVWFVAVWLVANTKNGTSSCELARAIGVTQKTAWLMLHRIRLAMRTGTAASYAGFDDLARKLVQVPKKEVVAAEKRYERKKKKRKKS